MRTFNNLQLLRDVMDNTSSTIGQRNYGLYRCYSMAFDWGLDLIYDDSVEALAKDMPSIEEFVTKQQGEDNNRTVRFDYYIGWDSEDQRELFERCCQKILEYENTFPISEKDYSFELKPEFNMDLKRDLKHIFKRPGMYGMEKLSHLRAYLDGYFRFKKEYKLAFSETDRKLIDFIKYWKEKVNKNRKFETWDRPFRLEKMGTTDFSGSSGLWEFERFDEILTEELELELDDPSANG